MNDDLTARITEALDGAPVHSFRKPIPGGWTCIYCGEASAKGPAGLPVLSGQPCRYAPGMGTIAPSLLAEARDEIARLRELLGLCPDCGDNGDCGETAVEFVLVALLSACTPQPAQVIPLDPPPLTCTVWDDDTIREIPCPALVDRDGTNTEQGQQ